MTTGGRSLHPEAILGSKHFSRLKQTKVLLVGAGGIGCELLKNLALTGFGHITLLDLDTIDLSNLNRQFLFRKKDVKQSKALVAAQAASAFNPNVKISPIHGNIKEAQFDVQWFQQFDIVLNALDNLDARRHVNKMCIAANIPLVESGTAGYFGQVQPLLKDKTECFDCIPKPTPKTYPVCTIRSTPSQPIHCIVWGKTYLMGQLFGEDEDAGNELDDAEKQGENAQEIANLRKEAQAFRTVRAALRSPNEQGSNAARMVFQKIYNSDIRNMLSMTDMWRARTPPQPLDYDAILEGTFVLVAEKDAGVMNGASNADNGSTATTNGTGIATANGATANGSTANGHVNEDQAKQQPASSLKDQQKLSLRDNLVLFTSSVNRLATRLQSGEDTIAFDKDDDDTLDFVTAAANLRSVAYGIEGRTRWEVKEMAGNIIPAIATTNAIIAGLIVLQALHILKADFRKLTDADPNNRDVDLSKLKNVHIQIKPAVPLSAISLSRPNPNCGVCRDTYVNVLCDPGRTRLGELVQAVVQSQKQAILQSRQEGGDQGQGEQGGMSGEREEEGDGESEDWAEVSVYEDKRILSDPDFDDNVEKTLESLNVGRGKFLAVVDEDGRRGTVVVSVGVLPPNHPTDAPPFILPSPMPIAPRKPPPPAPAPSTPPKTLLKRTFDEMEISEDQEPSAKRAKLPGGKLHESRLVNSRLPESPSKRKTLDEDGVVIMDGPMDEELDDPGFVIVQ
ncbi:hypothetical protein BDV98DRAFT_607348 [Pterulicium gracile]|uniref:Ubiquitin-activating enzyme E1-like n=1 Tax=Pterulicium gracile TaxID=1884261 RepID=A0A5C3Q698_9AGAR|nr:hypothetical protein BDV98DRAFT_607348 [Pterula gracilis]